MLRTIRPHIAAFFVLLAATSLSAQQHSPISGFWVLHYDGVNIPPATLTPAAKLHTAAVMKNDQYVRRFCDNVGTPAVMVSGPAIDVREGETETVILTAVNSTARHIYTDGRPHPAADIFDPTMNGNSIGRWVGNKLIVETVGFDARGILALPGGGYRSPTSRLVESFELVDDGKYLEVISTWTDPKVFAKPHTYLMRYSRAPEGYRAQDWPCVASDNNRGKALTDVPAPVVWPK
jgi:hypothetical protein